MTKTQIALLARRLGVARPERDGFPAKDFRLARKQWKTDVLTVVDTLVFVGVITDTEGFLLVAGFEA